MNGEVKMREGGLESKMRGERGEESQETSN